MKNIPIEEVTEVFCIDDKFFFDIEDYAEEFDEDEIKELPDDYKKQVDSCSLEKIFSVTDGRNFDRIIEAICETLTENNEERMPEDNDRIFEQIKTAIKAGIDTAKINEALPELWYRNGNYFYITKADLLDCL